MGLLIGNLSLAAGIAAAVLAVLLAHRERPGWLLSVTGTVRLRLLLVATGLSVAVLVASTAILITLAAAGVELAGALDYADTAGWPGIGPFAVYLAVILTTTPLQAAGEEFVFRGYLVQAAALWTRTLWIPGLATSLLFAAAHGPQDPSLFANRFAFGLIAWWLTIRTGGLEGAIAIHVVHNLAALIFAAALDDVDVALTATDIGPVVAVFDIALTVLIAALIARYARRSHARTRSVPAGGEPAAPAPNP